MTVRLGPIAGVYLKLDRFWVVAYALLAVGILFVGVPGQPQLSIPFAVALAMLAALALVLALALHEMTHGIVARWLGLPISEVALFAFTDRNAAAPTVEVTNGRQEALAAISGVIATFVAASLLFGLWFALPATSDEVSLLLRGLTWWAAAGNLALGVINSAVAYPYDGGRVVRGAVWAATGDKLRATRIASRIGRAFAVLLLLVGALWAAWTGELFYPLWLLVAGVFLLQTARRQYRRLEVGQAVEGVTVREVMTEDVSVVGPNLTLDTLFIQHERDEEVFTYPVIAEGALVGTIDVSQIERVPRPHWPRTRVGDVMTMLERLPRMTGGQSVMDALNVFERTTIEAIPVVDDENSVQLVGLVTRDGLLDKLRPRVRRQAERALGSPS